MITNKEAIEKVDSLYYKNIIINTWELEFISDMIDRTEFTDNQLEKIEELWRKYYA